ncbi:PREDICTED: protamine-like [Nicrophorus vespilloides]|uniref:Protamine-like n=1 Tax=Nicrophorus vespilloides TaxID=110193 RepID=A0ABM1ND26_NICVS|nr:PREDICTED: protamine-like [Nicrophorus vespilloides]
MGKHRSRSGCGKKKKCHRSGKVTRNPFLNFLRQFRRQHCGWSVVKIAVEGARVWCKMGKHEKEKYRREASCAPKTKYKRRKSRCGSKHGRKRSRSRRSRRSKRSGGCRR